MRKPTIVLVEDNPLQSENFVQSLEQYCVPRHLTVPKVDKYSAEGSFLESFKDQTTAADLYIFDLMLRWREVGEELTVRKPAKYHSDSAGIRCKDAVLKRFPDAKIVIWTVVEVDHASAEFAGARLCLDKNDISFIELESLYQNEPAYHRPR